MTFHFYCSNCDPKCETPLKTVTFQDYGRICHYTNSSDYNFLEFVIMKLGGKCPRCGHKLEIPPKNVTVTPYRKETQE